MTNKVESSNEDKYSHGWWKKVLSKRIKYLKEEWHDSAAKILDQYLDKRENNEDDSRYNLFWSNTTILKAALYAQKPKVSVNRQWQDPNDPIARTAALILERCLKYDLDTDADEMHQSVLSAVFDYLVPGGGVVWLRYQPVITQNPVAGPDGQPVMVKQVTDATTSIDYVNWKDFIWSEARRWGDVLWVAKRVWLTKEKYTALFGKEEANELAEALDNRDNKDKLPKGFTKNRFEVFEIFCKQSKKIYHISLESESAFKETPYVLDLPDFWPCPAPLLSNTTNEELLPTPDFKMCQDKYAQLNQLDARVHLLEKALRVAGWYDGNNKELGSLLNNRADNIMVPVENWAVFAEKGGGKGVVDWFPVEQISGVLVQLIEQKAEKVRELYELTGLSDIMRGASNPRETLGAQQLKAQYGSVRLQDRQLDVAKFVREILNIKAQIIMRHYPPQTILRIANITDPAEQANVDQAIQLLKNVEANKYRIEISEDSLAMPDYNQERDSRVEFMTMVGQFISQASPLVEMAPNTAPILGQMIKWAAAGFRGAKDMEATLDQLLKTLFAQQQQKPEENQGPSPEQVKLQLGQMKLQMDQQKLQSEQQKAQFDAQLQLQLAQVNNASKEAIANANNQTQILLQEMQTKMEAMQEDLNRAHEMMTQQIETNANMVQQNMQNEVDHEQAESQREHEKELTDAQNKLRADQGKTSGSSK